MHCLNQYSIPPCIILFCGTLRQVVEKTHGKLIHSMLTFCISTMFQAPKQCSSNTEWNTWDICPHSGYILVGELICYDTARSNKLYSYTYNLTYNLAWVIIYTSKPIPSSDFLKSPIVKFYNHFLVVRLEVDHASWLNW